MSDTFYPFVENAGDAQDGDDDDVAAPKQPARIAVYDSMTVPPRVVTVPPSDVRTYLDEITKNVWELATQQGGEWPWHIIRELVENYIHAQFIEPTISIMDKGQTISFSDQGPGIPNKQAALRPTFSSATKAMKRYIRGTGSGLPMVEATVKLQHGSISIEDNLGQGAVITVSLAHKDEPAQTPDAVSGASTSTNMGTGTAGAPGETYGMANPQASQAQGMWPGMAAPRQGYMQTPSQGQTYGMYGNPQMQQGFQQTPANMPQQQGMYAPQQGYMPSGQTGMYMQYPGQQGWPAGQGAYGPGGMQAQGTGMSAPMAGMPGAQGMPGPQPSWNPYQPQTSDTWPRNPAGPAGMGSQTPFGAGAGGAAGPQNMGALPTLLANPQTAAPAQSPIDPEEAQIIALFLTFEKVGGTEVAQATGMSNATAGRRLQKVAEAGFIVKAGQKYVLTEAGQRLFNEITQGR